MFLYLLISWGYRPKPCQRQRGFFSWAYGPILILGPAALRLPLMGLRPYSYPWAYGPAVATHGPTALFSSSGLRPCGCHSWAYGHVLALGPAALRLPLMGLRPVLLHVNSVKSAIYQKHGFLSNLHHSRKC